MLASRREYWKRIVHTTRKLLCFIIVIYYTQPHAHMEYIVTVIMPPLSYPMALRPDVTIIKYLDL